MEAERRRMQTGGGSPTPLCRASVKEGGPRHPELAAVLWAVCSRSNLKIPGEDKGTPGIPDADDSGGQEVWRQRLGTI